MVIPEEKYFKYNFSNSNKLVKFSSYVCCNCDRPKGGTNFSSMVNGIEYGVHKYADMLWCDKHYYEQMEILYP